MKKTRKFAVMAAAVLAAVMAVGGITAYFSDADTAANTFTVGKVSLDLQEPDWEPPTDITPNETITKNPSVYNDGLNDEFVFVEVVMPYKNIITVNDDGTKKAAADTELFTYAVNSGWTEIASEKDASAKTVTHRYVYGTSTQCTALAKDARTPSLFDSVKFVNAIEDQGLEEASYDIVLNAYGIQTSNVNGGTVKPLEVWSVIANQDPSTAKEAEQVNTDILNANLVN
ncbi:MAG: SipW-dependent-type signal peptide-containing protein [Eubacterium sp.]|nr:SipW-dependent-type signal peptide-containing protein [Eubacterium sp.]